jgi:hypothetical protein
MRRSDWLGEAPSRARIVRGLTAVAGCLLLLTGCASPGSEVVRTSGPLADGFEVEPGSALVGPVFPTAGGGWQAVIGVEGDVRPVFEGYVRQAEELGFPLESGSVYGDPRDPEGEWCSSPDDSPEAAVEIRCSAYSSALEGPWASLQGIAEPDGRAYIHLVAGRHSDAGVPPAFASAHRAASVTDVEVAAELATDGRALRVVEGSELLFDPLPGTCYDGSYLAMLRVPGDLASVMRGYEKEFGRVGAGSEGLVGSGDELSLAGGIAGGGDLSASAVRGDPSYVLIDRCVLN